MTMGVDKNMSDRKGKSVEPRKHRRGQQRRVMAVQNLYETCREVFANCGPDIVPSPENVGRVKAILDKMSGMDVGLRPTMPYFKPTGNYRPPEITYMRIHECDKFSIGIFCLPPKGVIPLHNHPGMTVFSKILFGKMHVQSYDWADAGPADKPLNASNPDGVRLAKVKVNSEFSAPCETNLLYPDDCNMHCFRAITACAVLDVLVPPYNDLEGRHCQYYSDHPFASFSDGVTGPEDQKESYVWLKEREMPDDLKFVGALYNGPKLVK